MVCPRRRTIRWPRLSNSASKMAAGRTPGRALPRRGNGKAPMPDDSVSGHHRQRDRYWSCDHSRASASGFFRRVILVRASALLLSLRPTFPIRNWERSKIPSVTKGRASPGAVPRNKRLPCRCPQSHYRGVATDGAGRYLRCAGRRTAASRPRLCRRAASVPCSVS
jgi:hypothetical protein